MTGCRWSDRELMSFADGAAGRATAPIAQHIAVCDRCRRTVTATKDLGAALRSAADSNLRDLDVEAALRRIRVRSEELAHEGLFARLRHAWQELVVGERRGLAGVALALALGALTAPALLTWLGAALERGGPGAGFAAVVVESLEVGGASTAVVLSDEDHAATLIWIETEEKNNNDAPSY